ncbi:hypothetical protein ABLE93_15755 [Xanthobacter sp. KR7-65]|uniref:hypothetical protein n=1 Tax=Xanthobacter sp. KR7-65 TaxID=3156612 RepID=UPI0032B3C241
MLPPPDSEEANTERAKVGALAYLAMRSIEDRALAGVAKDGQRIPTLAAEGLRKIGIILPSAWQEVPEALENLPVTTEIYSLAYRLDREVRLFWEMIENIRGSIVRNCEAGKILTLARAEAGGELTQLPAHTWSMQFWDPRFDSGAIDLLKPFPRRPDYIEFYHDPVKRKWTRLHIGAEERDRSTSGLHWIFFDVESFSKTYGETEAGVLPNAGKAVPMEPVDPYKSGGKGRPTAMHLIEAELRRRSSAGQMLGSWAQEAKALAEWLSENRADAPKTTPKAIRDSLAETYRTLRADPAGK